jgi:hypothetical protein
MFEALNRLPRSAKWHTDQFHQLSLRDKLSWFKGSSQQTGFELFIGFDAVHGVRICDSSFIDYWYAPSSSLINQMHTSGCSII